MVWLVAIWAFFDRQSRWVQHVLLLHQVQEILPIAVPALVFSVGLEARSMNPPSEMSSFPLRFSGRGDAGFFAHAVVAGVPDHHTLNSVTRGINFSWPARHPGAVCQSRPHRDHRATFDHGLSNRWLPAGKTRQTPTMGGCDAGGGAGRRVLLPWSATCTEKRFQGFSGRSALCISGSCY